MFKSLSKFFDEKCLEEFIIVTPSCDTEAVRSAIHPEFNQQKLRILNESLVCPEFLDNPDTLSKWPKPNKGWYRQQLIKLAIHEQVRTRFYLTVDSDVIFAKPFSSQSLFSDERAILNIQSAEDYRQLYRDNIATKEVNIRRERYKEARKILKCKRPDHFLNRWYGETPVLLSKDIVCGLTRHIEHTWNRPWRQVLLHMLPWTEYALYFQYAEYAGLLEKYYYPGDMNTLLSLNESLWRPADDYRIPRNLANWDVDSAFTETSPGIAVVVQSYLGYSVADVLKKVRHHIDHNEL